jgi:CheY-like chemotaxis protein
MRNSSLHEPKILVVEDDFANQRVLTMQVRHLGYSGDLVASAREALSALEKKEYHLVLLDCRMPEMDGLSFTKEVRSQVSQPWNNVVIIAVTADPILFGKDHCIANGVNYPRHKARGLASES